MAATVAAIYRYPVKGLSAERLDRVALTPGECLPHDRRFAIALDIVASLGRAFGHINMGVYAEVVSGGEVAIGDALLEPQAGSTGG
jgi:hypothetical protein